MTIAPTGQGGPYPVPQPRPTSVAGPGDRPGDRPGTAAASPVPEVPDGSVMLGGLAAALKGDALRLFSTVSDEDRRRLGGYVASGAMTGDELNDALNDRLKAERGRVIRAAWEAEDAARPPAEREAERKRSDEIRRLEMEMEDLRRRTEKLHLIRDKKDALAFIEYSKEMQMKISELRRSPGVTSSVAITGEFAVEKLYRSDGERSAGEKLTATGFQSATFDQALAGIAKADVAAIPARSSRSG